MIQERAPTELEIDLGRLASPEASNCNFCQLVILAGLGPATDFIGADLRDTDLSNLNLEAFDFTDADLRGARVEGTIFGKIQGAKFDGLQAGRRRQDIDGLLRIISSTPRQEERLAVVLQQVLHDYRLGLDLLERYHSDRARFATKALRMMQSTFRPDPMSPELVEHKVAKLVPWLFKEHYPLSQGELLFYLAKHLARYPIINEAIGKKLRESNSISVERLRADTERLLQQR
jgi:hypothetical protein